MRARAALLPIALVAILAASTAILTVAPGRAAAADPALADTPSIQYLEAVSHGAKTYTFEPGATVTVPFRPRPGDTTQVDGAAPVALPAGEGSTSATPEPSGPALVTPNGSANLLRREVFGFLPYWAIANPLLKLRYDVLSTIAYFGVALNLDGTLYKSGSGWNGWVSSTMTTVINDAHAHGTRVVLTIESFAWTSTGQAAQSALLGSSTASLTAAKAIAAEVLRRGADGVDLDFEPIASGQRANFVTFTRLLRAELDKLHSGYELTFCANGAPGTYDLPNLLAAGAADAVFIMGYDLRGGSPSTAGSIDPLISPYNHNTYTLTSVVNTFKSQVPVSKIILGLPWYGHAWSTGPTNNTVNPPPADIPTYGAPATGVSYATAKSRASQDPATTPCETGWPVPCVNGWQYDVVEESGWTAYYGDYGGTQTTWRELYFDDARSFGAKMDAINGWNLRGVGIWALGYDSNNGGDGDLAQAIATKMLSGRTGATYVPIAPIRFLDTRAGNGLSGKVTAGVPATFQVTGRGGVPDRATAVTGNLTVVDETNGWAVYLGPNPVASPPTSTVNFLKGQIVGNSLTVALSSTGALSATYLSTAGNTTNLVFDVTGYFLPDLTGATYVPLTPTRLLDTRIGNGLTGTLSAGVPRTLQVAGRGGVPANATAVTGNLTAVNSTNAWAVFLGPTATANPTASTVNFTAGQIVSNGLTVALSATGTLSATYLSTPNNTTDLVLDVTGYFTPDSTGSTYVAITPARLLDTRYRNGMVGPLVASAPRSFQVSGRGGVAARASSVTAQVTVVNSTNGWAVFLGPIPAETPSTSMINFLRAEVRGNGITTTLDSNGALNVTYMSTSGNTTDLVVDVTGYFVP